MVFGITNDPTILKFIKCVKKHPSVYKHKNISRLNKKREMFAWKKIAAKLNSTAHYCKDRWTHLKGCYKRYLQLKAENKTKKTYYLENHMKFLKPYISLKLRNKKRRKAVPVHSDEDNIIMEDIQITNDNTNMEESNDISGNPICIVDDSSEDEEVAFNTGSSALEGCSSSTDGYSGENSNETSSNEHENSILYFYKSLLPEINLMTPEQNLRFRKELLNTINIILNGEDLNSDVFKKNNDVN